MCYIGNPDAADFDTTGFQLLVHLIPHGFVEFLYGMSAILPSFYGITRSPLGIH